MTSPASRRGGAVAVIPCLNERAHIARLIATLLGDPRWRDPLVVVADGGSTDGTREIVAEIAERDGRVRLLHNEKRLQSAGVNLAASLFAGARRWMVRVDAHAGYPPDYVSALLEEAGRTGATCVVVGMNTAGSGLFQSAAAAAQNSRLGTGGSAHRVRGAEGWVDHGHHALFDIDAFGAVGGYDEGFSHNEDAELDARLRRAGGRIWLTRAVEVVYYPRSRPGPLFRQYFNYGRGRARTLMRHRERPKLRQLLPVAVAPSLLLLPFAATWPMLAAPALAWAAACLGYGTAIAARARSAGLMLSGPVAMLMHSAWSLGFWSALAAPPRSQSPRVAPSGGAVTK